ncbi:hypothetical protein TYRP_003298 [Tyrophagus putrescentiae]|nr:hypothetical protein TYRP_003298 [Tyrophagus putrescentiae]
MHLGHFTVMAISHPELATLGTVLREYSSEEEKGSTALICLHSINTKGGRRNTGAVPEDVNGLHHKDVA